MHASLIGDTSGITPSVIGALRALAPRRPLTIDESLRIARLQANTLLRVLGIEDGPVPVEFIDFLPHLRVIQAPLPVSGVSHWTGKEWIITVSNTETWRRQRATIAHEFKHIIDHSRADYLYVGDHLHSAGGTSRNGRQLLRGLRSRPSQVAQAGLVRRDATHQRTGRSFRCFSSRNPRSTGSDRSRCTA